MIKHCEKLGTFFVFRAYKPLRIFARTMCVYDKTDIPFYNAVDRSDVIHVSAYVYIY